jgi:hypothetical protein
LYSRACRVYCVSVVVFTLPSLSHLTAHPQSHASKIRGRFMALTEVVSPMANLESYILFLEEVR